MSGTWFGVVGPAVETFELAAAPGTPVSPPSLEGNIATPSGDMIGDCTDRTPPGIPPNMYGFCAP